MSALSPFGQPDPLTKILFSPTTEQAGPSARDRSLQTSELGRSRSGNTMGRSRLALLRGARRAVEKSGSDITLAQVAAGAGVAKATLYNHFQTREEILAALLVDEVERLIAAVGHLELAEALIQAANAVSEHPLLESLAADDMGLLVLLARVDVRTAGWSLAGSSVQALLSRAGREGTPTVLRWLASFIVVPADERDIAADVQVLVTGLPRCAPDRVANALGPNQRT
jgi:AcrR family transcriptional regulator